MGEIVYLEDIIKELSEELKIPERELEELIRFSIKHSHKLMVDPNVISINYHNLGVLHFNVSSASSIYKKRNIYRRFVSIIDSKIAIINEEYLLHKNLVHKRASYFSRFKKIFFPNRKERQAVTRVEVLKRIEKKQNKI